MEDKCEEYLVELELLKSSRGGFKDGGGVLSKDASPCGEDVLSPVSRMTEERTTIVGGGVVSVVGSGERDSDIISLKLFAEDTNRKHEIERCQRINAEAKLQRACVENKDLRDHIKFLEHRLKSNNNNKKGDDDEDEEFKMAANNGDGGGKSLSRSRSLTSLSNTTTTTTTHGCQDNTNNIQYEVDELQSRDHKHLSRDMHLTFDEENKRDTACDVTDGESTNQMRLCESCRGLVASPLSPRSKEINIKDFSKDFSGLLRSKKISASGGSSLGFKSATPTSATSATSSTSMSPGVATSSTSTTSPTVDNYRDMFAEIFEKLKISRPVGAGGRPM